MQEYFNKIIAFATLEPLHHGEESLEENLKIFMKVYELISNLLNSMKKVRI